MSQHTRGSPRRVSQGSYCVSPCHHLLVVASGKWVQTHCSFAARWLRVPQDTQPNMKESCQVVTPSICIPPQAASGKKEGTREVQLCIQHLVLNMSTSR